MCKVLSNMHVPTERSKDEPEYNFRKILVNRCQVEFEKNSVVELNREAKLTLIEQTADPVSIDTESKQVYCVSWCNSLYYVYVSTLLVAISCSAAGSMLFYIHSRSSVAVIVSLRLVIFYNFVFHRFTQL
jgi:hypothetical protein